MGYGIEIYNEGGTLIIDSSYQNWALWEHGESVSTGNSGDYHETEVTFASAVAYPPLIAIKPDTDDYCGMSYYLQSGANYSGFAVTSEDKVVTFSWQAFVPRRDSSGVSYGLEVYNVSGDMVFDSGYAPMIITDVDTTTPAYNAVSTVTFPSDANAYHIMSPWGRIQTIGEWNGSTSTIRNYLAMFKNLSATTVSFGGREFSNGTIPVEISQTRGWWPATWTILTVKKSWF